MNGKTWIVIAGLLGASGVTLGAYHAHGLEKSLSAKGVESVELGRRMANCETAVRFQLFHAPVLLAIGIWLKGASIRLANVAAFLFLAGIGLFSGGLYLFVFTGQLGHWAIVPSGGLCLIIAWLVLSLAGLKEWPSSGA